MNDLMKEKIKKLIYFAFSCLSFHPDLSCLLIPWRMIIRRKGEEGGEE